VILTVATRATTGTGQGVPEAFTVLTNAPIILAGAALTDFLHTSLKRIWAFLQGRLDGMFSISADIFVRIQATHTRADTFLARFLLMEAGAVELETSRANTVARDFTRRKLLGLRMIGTSREKGSWIPCQNIPNSQGASTARTAFVDRVLAVGTRAVLTIATATGLEALAVQGDALGLGTTAPRRVLVHGAHLQGSLNEEVQLSESFLSLESRIRGG
jgi:hypothetical protein